MLVRDAVKLPLPADVPFPGVVLDKNAPKPEADEPKLADQVEAADTVAEETAAAEAEAPASDENKEG